MNILKINLLKSKLSKSDYKVIKCMEAQLMGKEMPYDVDALVAERDCFRAKINEIEAEITANPMIGNDRKMSLKELMKQWKIKYEANVKTKDETNNEG